MTEIFVELGHRPPEDEGSFTGRKSYPAEVVSRLAIDAKEILDRYPSRRSALLPLLHLVQSEDGYVTRAGIEFCAGQVGLTSAEVTAVASFYSMYRREPTGDYLVGVCTNTLCAVLGGDAILARLSDELGVRPGGTTEDGKVTLEHVECNAGCDYAPVLMVNWEFFDNQTPAGAVDLVDGLRGGRVPEPRRGAPPCTFKETARILAGFADERPDAVAAALPGDPTLAGLRLARDVQRNVQNETGGTAL
ncbi:NADH-quinone oxidoreductase subunit NuoE [Mycobacteroides immunogenum]|uniref:NADH dehydrogenase n=1 Tax=Mycobacteroides immunogenum TaxID=83262 RepID=A0A7V8LN93_9MYCO|nr:NADH-quinone oxidoreductase subunit NuoE [Mycobacteroides immunogenum]AMT70811.1 NADH dehydrogenase [Mycobacteroides immunogenum]ANO03919.1 NADH-quinone oxidoreductase subunit E [Mycobacteroides immunogenum]KIU40436.1 NADH dehydrogenase [Mycobacteroides immunogenum]KPG09030.1 NADH dehydrogenase [Mycobacteroides immunogenum]KPG09245.1 NADH dehydrogenase [Mycobacteroides immunogenum]